MYSKEFLIEKIRKANDYWQGEKPESGNASWERGAYMTGNIAAYEVTGEKRYIDYATKWALDNEWKFYKNLNAKKTAINGDSLIGGEAYLYL